MAAAKKIVKVASKKAAPAKRPAKKVAAKKAAKKAAAKRSSVAGTSHIDGLGAGRPPRKKI
jgi:hypothetical protein